MTTHCSILAWRIPWTEEPGRLPTMGSQELDMTEATEHTTEQWPNYTVLKIRSMDFSAFM